jgi:CPA2 family monovalent cation:H+ antiporter-2
VKLNLLPTAGRDLILAGAILSILLNPLIFAAADRLSRRLETSPGRDEADGMQAEQVAAPASRAAPEATGLTDHTILVGYGRVGSIVAETLKKSGQLFLIIEDADKVIAQLRERKIETIAGNAAKSDVLKAANLSGARYLLVAIPEAFEAGQIVQQARAANPAIQIIARAHSDAEVEHLKSLGADLIIMGEREIALGIIQNLFDWQARRTAVDG